MAKPIYKMFTARPSEAWHQLSKEEQADLFRKVAEALEKVGGKSVLLCNASWSSERWPVFGVEEFPTIEAVQQHATLLAELNWYRYLESATLLGTTWDPPMGRSISA